MINLFVPSTLQCQKQDCHLTVESVDAQNILFTTTTASKSTALFLVKTTSSIADTHLDYVFILRDDSSIDLILSRKSSPSYSIILYSPPNVSQLQAYSIKGLSLSIHTHKRKESKSADSLRSKLSMHATEKPVKKDGLTDVINSINTIPSLPPSPTHWIISIIYSIFTSTYLFTSSIGFAISSALITLLSYKITASMSLLDVSSTLVQLHLRLTQALFWPSRWREWRSSPQSTHAKYIGFNISPN